MIQLKIAPYCHNCPIFEPKVEKNVDVLEEYIPTTRDHKTLYCRNTIITCVMAATCEGIKNYLDKEKKDD